MISTLVRFLVQVPSRREYFACFSFAAVAYSYWALLARPQALDLSAYLLAGQAVREGISPYYESPAWHILASSRGLAIPFAPYPYPPSFNQIVSVIALVPFSEVRAGLLLLSIAAYFLLLLVLAKEFAQPPRYLLIGMLLYLPVLNCLASGNVHLLLVIPIAILLWKSSGTQIAPRSVHKKTDFVSGVILGVSIVLKPILWPVVLLALFRRRHLILLGTLLSGLLILLISIIAAGLQPWMEYLRELPRMMTIQPYIENQSVAAVVTRLIGEDWGNGLRLVVPIAVIALWFGLYNRLTFFYELISLFVISVFISPIDWYYYFIFLVPAYWYLFSRCKVQTKWFNGLLILSFLLVQAHGFLWSRVGGHAIIANFAFAGMTILTTLLFYKAHILTDKLDVTAKDFITNAEI